MPKKSRLFVRQKKEGFQQRSEGCFPEGSRQCGSTGQNGICPERPIRTFVLVKYFSLKNWGTVLVLRRARATCSWREKLQSTEEDYELLGIFSILYYNSI